MATQLRLFTINRDCLQQFAEEWQDKILPLRTEHGFHVLSAWVIAETNQFAWLISYSGDESWNDREASYYASASRAGLEPNPARLIARAEEYFVDQLV